MKLKIITATVAVLLIFLAMNSAITNAQIEPTTTNPETGLPEIPDVDIELPQIVPTVDIGKRVQDVMDLWNISGVLDIFNVGEAGAMIDNAVDLLASLINNVFPAIIQSVFNVGGIAGVLGGAVSVLNTVGVAVWEIAQTLGLTVAGALGLGILGFFFSIGGFIINLVVSIIGDLLLFAYSTGIGGISILGIILGFINLFLIFILSGVVAIVLAIEVVLGIMTLFTFTLLSFLPLLVGTIFSAVVFLVLMGMKFQQIVLALLSLPTGLPNLLSILTIPIHVVLAGYPFVSAVCGTIFSCLNIPGSFLLYIPIVGVIILAILLVIMFAAIFTILGAVGGLILGGVIGVILLVVIVLIAIVGLPLVYLAAAAIVFIIGAILGVIAIISLILTVLLVITIAGIPFALFTGFFTIVFGILAISILGLAIGMPLLVVFYPAYFIVAFIIAIIISIIIGIIALAIAVVGLAILGLIVGGIIGVILCILLLPLLFLSLFSFILAPFMQICGFPILYSCFFFGTSVVSIIADLILLFIEDILSGIGMVVNFLMLLILQIFVQFIQTIAISEIVSVIVLFTNRIASSVPFGTVIGGILQTIVGLGMLTLAALFACFNIVLYPFNLCYNMCVRFCESVMFNVPVLDCRNWVRRPLGWQ